MYRVSTQASFDAAHFLKDYPGKCHNLHGHRWKVVIEVSSPELDEGSMVIDFTDIKKELKKMADHFDHCLIIEEGSLKKDTYEALLSEDFRIVTVNFRPTAECFAKYFFDQLSSSFPVTKVQVYETPNNVATYEV